MSTLEDAIARASESRNLLVEYLIDFPVGHKIWKVLADAMVDYRIQGYLEGVESVTEFVELNAYSRGYIDGLIDDVSRP